MLKEILNSLKIFRDKIYHFFHHRQDAAMDLLDSLSSNIQAKSVVELSLNPLHRRNYCSITRVLGEFYSLSNEKEEKEKVKARQNQVLTKLLSEYCPQVQERLYHVFGVDCTSNPRVFSPTLANRSFVHSPNPVSGNKPITIGHQYSIAAYLPEKAMGMPPWLIPLSCERVNTDQKGAILGMQQLSSCIQAQKSFKKSLCVSVGDCAYSSPECLAEAQKNSNQVHISRARNNRNFYYPLPKKQGMNPRGRPKRYGKKHDLSDKTTWGVPDQRVEFEINQNGKMQKIEIECWNSLIMRGNRKSKASDYPFRLFRVRVYKLSGELLFKKPLWLLASGERRIELSLQDVFNVYRQRFDLEHFFRFGKNRLLMDKAQTPEVDHEEAWWQFCIIAYVQLYLAREFADHVVNPWEKYLPVFHQSTSEKSPTQVQKDFARIIRQFGTPAQSPKPRKKSSGRKKGEKQKKRKRHEVIFKKQISENSVVMTL